MDQRKVLMIAGALGVLLLAIIIGTVVYVSRSASTNNDSTRVVTSSPFPVPSTAIPSYSPSTSPRGNVADQNNKVYFGSGFQVKYPKAWGILTCNNSQNFELDPDNSTDQLKATCDRASRPITFIVGSSSSCPGQSETLGSIKVIKSVDPSGGRTDYLWCTQTNPSLRISTRYSPNGGTATSTTDYSSQVEQLIQNITFTGS